MSKHTVDTWRYWHCFQCFPKNLATTDNFNAENAVSAGGTLNFTIDIAPGVGGATVSTPVTVEFGSASLAADQWTVDDPATDTLNVSGDSSSGNFSWTFDGSRLDIDFAVPTDQTAKGQATTDQVFGFHVHATNTAGGTATATRRRRGSRCG